MIDEGYTKFKVNWHDRAPLDCPEIAELEKWRRPLFDAGLVGHYADINVGYGNISLMPVGTRQFIISGTQTGNLAKTDCSHYALVTRYDIAGNSVACRGAVQASSESLTHAAVYELDAAIHAVVHVHSDALWERMKDAAPTTRADVAYGTPEMAREFKRLFRETRFADSGLAVMAGHDSGIVSFGKTLREAAVRVIAAHEEIAKQQQEKA